MPTDSSVFFIKCEQQSSIHLAISFNIVQQTWLHSTMLNECWIRLTEVLGLKDVCDRKLTIPSIAVGSNITCTIKVVYSQARVCLTLNKFIHVTIYGNSSRKLHVSFQFINSCPAFLAASFLCSLHCPILCLMYKSLINSKRWSRFWNLMSGSWKNKDEMK